MPKIFRVSSRESRIISEIESSREHARRVAFTKIKESQEQLCNALATKLVEKELIETTNKPAMEEQFMRCLDKLVRSEEFDIDYQIAPYRLITDQPNTISLYITAFILEQLIKHKDVIDIFGSDEDIYECVNSQIKKITSQVKKETT